MTFELLSSRIDVEMALVPLRYYLPLAYLIDPKRSYLEIKLQKAPALASEIRLILGERLCLYAKLMRKNLYRTITMKVSAHYAIRSPACEPLYLNLSQRLAFLALLG